MKAREVLARAPPYFIFWALFVSIVFLSSQSSVAAEVAFEEGETISTSDGSRKPTCPNSIPAPGSDWAQATGAVGPAHERTHKWLGATIGLVFCQADGEAEEAIGKQIAQPNAEARNWIRDQN